MSRVLGIDYGRRRAGFAVSDETRKIAVPLATVKLRSIDDLVAKIKQVIMERGINEIVIGNPIRTDTGQGSELSCDVLVLKAKIESELGCVVHLVPEWFSSVEAQKLLKSHAEKHLKRKGLVDKLSAALILQTFLDKQ